MSRYVPTYDLGDLVLDLGLELQSRGLATASNQWSGFDVAAPMRRKVRVALNDVELIVLAFDERMVVLGQARLSGEMITPTLVDALVQQYLAMLAEVGEW